MNPETPMTPREETEVRLTALLMGELPPDEAAALEKKMAADLDLQDLHARLRQAMELLREATALPEQPAPPVPAQLSSERRERLLAHFKNPAPAPSAVIVKPRRDWSWVVPLGLAASLIALLGGTVLMSGFAVRFTRVEEPPDFSAESLAAESAPQSSQWSMQPGAVRSLRESDARRQWSGNEAPPEETVREKSDRYGFVPPPPSAPATAPQLAAITSTAAVPAFKLYSASTMTPADAPAPAPTLDLFSIPVTDGATISEPLSAAGKIQGLPQPAPVTALPATPTLQAMTQPAGGARESAPVVDPSAPEKPAAMRVPPFPGERGRSIRPGGKPAPAIAAGQPSGPITAETDFLSDFGTDGTAKRADSATPTRGEPRAHVALFGDQAEPALRPERVTLERGAKQANEYFFDGGTVAGGAGGGGQRDKSMLHESLDEFGLNGGRAFGGGVAAAGDTLPTDGRAKSLGWFEKGDGIAKNLPDRLDGENQRGLDASGFVAPSATGLGRSAIDTVELGVAAGKDVGQVEGKKAKNPVVGRAGFWSDDESTKLNINTATEGTFWDTPAQPKSERYIRQNVEMEKDKAAPSEPAISGKKMEVAKLQKPELKEAIKQVVEEDVLARRQVQPAALPQPEIATSANAFSTFSLNVSDVAFKLAAASLEQGKMPEPATVRSEEFINAFDYRDPEPTADAPLACTTERARYPFAQNRDLLRCSVKTAAAGRQPGRALNIVLLLDNSGSMERADRVRIVREAMRVLSAQLQPQDKLSVVTFSRTPRLWADGVAGDKAGEMTARVGEITPQGGTNVAAALDLGYATALRHYQPGSINRVVLLTDGAANLGDVNPDALKQKVEAHRKQGVALDCFGIGWEGYDDTLLEALSRNGDGRYGFINTPEEAATEFAAQLAGALRVAASDVKVQVEWNPRRVTSYRQIGYAKHQLKKEQFRDNTVDAAEIGAAESGNALYVCEVNPRGEGDLATVRVRFKVPGTSDYKEHEWTVPYTKDAPPLEQASPALRLAGTASAFSEWLTASPYAAEVTTDRLLGLLNGVPAIYGADPRPQKLEWMIRTAKSLSGR